MLDWDQNIDIVRAQKRALHLQLGGSCPKLAGRAFINVSEGLAVLVLSANAAANRGRLGGHGMLRVERADVVLELQRSVFRTCSHVEDALVPRGESDLDLLVHERGGAHGSQCQRTDYGDNGQDHDRLKNIM